MAGMSKQLRCIIAGLSASSIGRPEAAVPQYRDPGGSRHDVQVNWQERAMRYRPRMIGVSAGRLACGAAPADVELVGREDVSISRPLAGTADRAAGDEPA